MMGTRLDDKGRVILSDSYCSNCLIYAITFLFKNGGDMKCITSPLTQWAPHFYVKHDNNIYEWVIDGDWKFPYVFVKGRQVMRIKNRES